MTKPLSNPRKRGSWAVKHGMIHAPEYESWRCMKYRCNNHKNANYYLYGGRGIKVCKRWESFQNFYADMGAKPTAQHSLDRKNNNGNYEPSNCRWATPTEQQRNSRQNRQWKIAGVIYNSLAEASEKTGIHRATIQSRSKKEKWRSAYFKLPIARAALKPFEEET